MARTMNEGLDIILAAAASKLDWASRLETALGATRTIQLRWDANPAAVDPWATGAEKINVAITGALANDGGNISGFGVTGAAVTQLAVDLTSGSAVIRTTGNGNFWQASIGLSHAKQTQLGITPLRDYDLYLPGNPTTTSGIAFAETCRLNAPADLPSGIGPAAPAPHAAAPVRAKIWNLKNPAVPVLMGTMVASVRQKDFVFSNVRQQTINGDTRIYTSPTTVSYDNHEFCCMLSVAAAVNGKNNDVPLCTFYNWTVPRGQWAGYPSLVGWTTNTIENFPAPYKITLEDEAGNLLYTHELPGGAAYNAALPESPNSSGPFWLHMTTATPLIWQNTPAALSPHAHSIFKGIDSRSMNESQAAVQYACNGPYVAITGDKEFRNGMAYTRSMAAYPLATTEYNTQVQTNPYIFDINNLSYAAQWCHGFVWVGGQPNGHDWLTGPGGSRSDRAFMPEVLVQYLTDPTGSRLQGNVPYEDLARYWGKAYWNRPWYYVPIADAKLFKTIHGRQWGYYGAYYNATTKFGEGGADQWTIPLFSPSQSDGPADINMWRRDKDGRLHWNGHAPDDQHDYGHPMLFGTVFRDTSFAIAQKFKTNATFMSQLGQNNPTAWSREYFLVRVHAWRMENFMYSWLAASDHYLQYTVAEIAGWLKDELENQWAQIYNPIVNLGEVSYYADAVRNLGHGANIWSNGTTSAVVSSGGTLGYYMSGVLAIGARIGFLDFVRSLSTKCAEMLDFIILCLDKGSSTCMVYTECRNLDFVNSPTFMRLGPYYPAASAPVVFSSWADAAAQTPADGAQDWIHQADGTFYQQYNGMHTHAQHPYFRKHFGLKSTPYVDTDAAIVKFDGYFNTVEANIAAAVGYPAKRAAAFPHRLRCHGTPLPPDAFP